MEIVQESMMAGLFVTSFDVDQCFDGLLCDEVEKGAFMSDMTYTMIKLNNKEFGGMFSIQNNRKEKQISSLPINRRTCRFMVNFKPIMSRKDHEQKNSFVH